MTVRNNKPNFKILRTNEMPSFDKITSVAVVAFDEYLNILIVNLQKRGVDIPGGHIERIDSTIYDTAKRETREEACAELEDDLKVSAVIESDYYEQPTYMIVLTGKVKNLKEFKKTDEVIAREFVSPENFLKNYGYDKILMKEIIERSLLLMKDSSKID